MGKKSNKSRGGKPPVSTPSSSTSDTKPNSDNKPKKCFYLIPEHYIPSSSNGQVRIDEERGDSPHPDPLRNSLRSL